MTTSAIARGSVDLVQGEYRFTERDFQRIAAMLHEEAGIALSPGKTMLVYSRLSKRLRQLGLVTFEAYCELVTDPANRDERRHMLAALTTNVTRFFREPHHFEHLRTTVLPDLLAGARRGARIRLWSAACSTGAEPYSIALMVLAAMPDACRHDIKILATDIDPNVVATTRQGSYAAELLGAVPAELRARWFQPSPSGDQEAVEITPELRQLVAVRELNLIGPWPMAGAFDVVFCRNVAIYFDEATQTRLWARLTALLAPGGFLYIGHSERVAGPASRTLSSCGITIYRQHRGDRQQDGQQRPRGAAS